MARKPRRARSAADATSPLDGRTFTFVLFDGGPGGGSFKGELLSDGKTISGEVKATDGLGAVHDLSHWRRGHAAAK